MAGDLDCCLDILIHVAQRLRDSDDVPGEELASAAKRVSDALTKEVGHSQKGVACSRSITRSLALLPVHGVYDVS